MNKTYDIEFKTQAVELLLTSAKSIKQVARELGCSASSLGEWKRLYEQENSTLATSSSAMTRDQLLKRTQELEKELKRVTQEREILKKATAILGN